MSSFKKFYYRNIGKKVRFYRKKYGYTQEQLSDILDLNLKYIGHIERSERCISNKVLIKLLELFKVQPVEFFDFDEVYPL